MTELEHRDLCRGALTIDDDFARDMDAYGCTQRRWYCPHGHSVYAGLPDLSTVREHTGRLMPEQKRASAQMNPRAHRRKWNAERKAEHSAILRRLHAIRRAAAVAG